MKTKHWFILIASLALAWGLLKAAEENWVVTRATMSHICHAQRATSRPYLGEVLGTYGSKAAAEKALAEFKESGTCE